MHLPFLLFSHFSLSSFRIRPPFEASFSRPKILHKGITLNWKENSVKVQSVVHEREKRKAKEGATFFLFRWIPDRREKLLYLLFFSLLSDNWSAQSAMSFANKGRGVLTFVLKGNTWLESTRTYFIRDNFASRIIDINLWLAQFVIFVTRSTSGQRMSNDINDQFSNSGSNPFKGNSCNKIFFPNVDSSPL